MKQVMSLKNLLFWLACSSFIYCSCQKDEAINWNKIETLYYNGDIYTVNENQPKAEAMIIKGGKIIAIGGAEIENLASTNAYRVNLNGAFVMPGIHDVHMHPLEAASENFQFSLDENALQVEDYVLDIEKAIDQNESSDWILGWGFDLNILLNTPGDPREILDQLSSDKPIAIMERTSHSVWVNSKALQIAQIDSNSTDPSGGIIMKDANGIPNGLLIDNAGNEMIDIAISSTPDQSQNDYDGLVNFALPELAKNGITSICDARTYWKREHHKIWQRIANEDKLTARVNLGLWIYPSEDDNYQVSELKSLYQNDSASLLKINQIKLYSDGIVINTTSAMHNDFNVNLLGLSTNNGLNYIDESRMTSYISALEPVGFDFHIHAIGDRGVHEALNAIESAGSNSGRHRLTHVEYVNHQDLPRFKQLNVTADAQVAGDFSQPEHWHENDHLVNPSLNSNIIPIKSLLENNARLTLSSDWDVSDLNPFIGIQNAVTRAPQEIAITEAIKAYTIDAAYIMRQEETVGTLEVGKDADFIILNQNITEIPSEEISYTKVLETYLKGTPVFKR
ncbi:MAG: amidohydrolase [Flavobacteriales bacterium]|nr:amidohydrolase [Flavobacteriales bacterium]